MRPLPSISAEPIPRRASCAARIVPDAPPPTIATGTRRSDFIIGPHLWVRRPGFALDHMVMHPLDRLAGSLGEPARHHCVDDAGHPRGHQLCADLQRADAMTKPTQAKRAGM